MCRSSQLGAASRLPPHRLLSPSSCGPDPGNYCLVQPSQEAVPCASLLFFCSTSAEEEEEEKARSGWIECAGHHTISTYARQSAAIRNCLLCVMTALQELEEQNVYVWAEP